MKMQNFKDIDGKVYKEKDILINRMVKRGLNSKLFLGVFAFIFLVGFISAGNVIVKEGDVYTDGYVGIGTTSPIATLEVGNGAYTTTALFTNANRNTFGVGGNETGFIVAEGSVQAGLVLDDSGGASGERNMRLINAGGFTKFQTLQDTGSPNVDDIIVMDNSNGFVGIGTASPRNLLEISSINTAIFEIAGDSDDTGGEAFDARLIMSTDGGGFGVNITYAQADGTGDLTFGFFGGSDVAEAMRINGSTGNVGIGTASPSEALEVDGLVRLNTVGATGAGIWYDGNTASKRAFVGMKYASDILFRLYGATVGDIMSWRLDTGRVGIGTTTPGYPLTVMGNASGVSIYAENDISATGFITRTSLFDKNKVAHDYIKDADSYKDKDGKIDHSKFYGYTQWESADLSRPVAENVTEEVCDDENVCEDVISEVITYPYTAIVEGVNLESEINVLRQAVYEMGQELCSMGRESFC